MKKTLLFASLLTVGVAFGQCTEIFISEYVEGSGNDKALELYNPTSSPITLNGVYTIERHSNGASDAVNGGTLNLVGVIVPGQAFVIVNGQLTDQGTSSPASSPALRAMADLLDGVYPAPTYMNGNDAILLKKNGVIIDIFGKSGDPLHNSSTDSWSDAFPYDGSNGAGAWWTKDHSLQRKFAVTRGVTVNPDPSFIVTQEWDSLPKDTWTNLGTHTCNCVIGLNELKNSVEFNVFPNPARELLTITTNTTFISATIINVLGKVVLTKNNDEKLNFTSLNVKNLDKGIYIIQIIDEKNNISSKQLIIE